MIEVVRCKICRKTAEHQSSNVAVEECRGGTSVVARAASDVRAQSRVDARDGVIKKHVRDAISVARHEIVGEAAIDHEAPVGADVGGIGMAIGDAHSINAAADKNITPRYDIVEIDLTDTTYEGRWLRRISHPPAVGTEPQANTRTSVGCADNPIAVRGSIPH